LNKNHHPSFNIPKPPLNDTTRETRRETYSKKASELQLTATKRQKETEKRRKEKEKRRKDKPRWGLHFSVNRNFKT
jgi:hypothetical protein